MQDKTIKSILKKKINDWANNIDNAEIKSIIKNKTIITGGALTSLFLNEEPKDYDVYLKDKDSCKKLAQYYIDKWNKDHDNEVELQESDNERLNLFISSSGVASEDESILEEPFEDAAEEINKKEDTEKDNKKEKYRPVFFSSNAITLSDKIQFMTRFYGSAEEIHKTYDFLHCTAWYDPKENKLNYTSKCLRSIMDKRLVYRGSLYPVCSVIRTRKFIKRGWKISAGEYLKMCFQISKLDLTDINILSDQLIGVDSAYFNMLIKALKSKKEEDSDFEINEGYLSSLIDKIF